MSKTILKSVFLGVLMLYQSSCHVNVLSSSSSGLKVSSNDIHVLPFPQKISVSETMFELSGQICIVNAVPGEVAKYAAKRLKRDLRDRVGIDAKITKNADQNASLIIKLELKKFKPEGYRIHTEQTENGLIYTISGNDSNGVLYGTFTILQVIHSASAACEKVVAPTVLSVEDWPTMKIRLLPTEVNKLPAKNKQVIATAENRLDWSSFYRFNAFWTYFTKEEEIARLNELAKKRGMALFGVLSLTGELRRKSKGETKSIDDWMCPSHPDILQFIREYFEVAAKGGCGGLVLSFDDLSEVEENHFKRCAKCKSRFNSLAETQLPLIQEMLKVAQKYNIKQLIVCPTPYARDSADQERYKGYYATLCAPEYMKNVKVFHCEVYPDKIAHLTKLGLKNYMWYNNGLWPSHMYYEGTYMGIPKIHYVWYGTKACAAEAAGPAPGVLNALGTLADFCEYVYPSPTGSDVGRAMGGCLAWNPKAAVDKRVKLRRTLVETLFGRGSWKSYKTWEDNMIACFSASRYDALNTNKAKRESQINKAETALNQLIIINKNAKALNAPAAFLKRAAEKSLKQMRATIVGAQKSLNVTAMLPPVRKLSKITVPEDVALYLEFDSFSGDRFVNTASTGGYGLFRGNPVLKKGVLNNALFFNGKSNYFEMRGEASKYLNPGTGSFSIGCWVFMMGQSWNSFVCKRSSIRPIYRCPGWALGTDSRGNTFRFTIEDTNAKHVSLSCSSKEMLYKWHYLVAVRDVSDKKVRLYLDGILRDTKTDITGDVTNKLPLICGADKMTGWYFWGLLDNVTYWNKALSSDEIKKTASILSIKE